MLFINVSKGVRVHITILRLVVYNFFYTKLSFQL